MNKNSQKKKILIVDDDEFFIEFERAFLQREHFEIFEARDGKEAMSIIRDKSPDLVLLDLYMPSMGGMEVVVRARAEGFMDLPIIIVSKEEDSAKITELKEAGANDFITKPVEIDELTTKINTYLNESHRASHRLPTSIKLRYRTLDELLRAETKDISTSGIFVRTKKDLEVGQLVELFLYAADDDEAEPIKILGEVVRTRQGDDENSGAGLKFINLEPASVKLISGLLEDELAKSKVDILIVDDDKVIREMLYDSLTDAGYKTGKCDNAIEALKQIDKLNPSLILADILMPGMSGIEFCETFRKNARHEGVPFIFVSSKVDKETVMMARNSGATFFIAKPFDMEHVLNKVGELISKE